MESSTFSFIA